MIKALVVDLCGTIVRENTTHEFIRSMRASIARTTLASIILSKPATRLTRAGAVDINRRLLLMCLRGLPRDQLRRAAADYASARLAENGRNSVLDEIAEALDGGVEVYLASASIDIVVSAFAEELGIARFVASELAYGASGRCLGYLASDSRGRKLARIKEQYQKELRDYRVITDNKEDLDLICGATTYRFIDGNAD